MLFIFHFLYASIPVGLVGSNREFILKAPTGSTILPSVFWVEREAEVRGWGRWLKEDGPGQERPWNPNRGDRHRLETIRPGGPAVERRSCCRRFYLLIRDTFIHQQITLPQDYCQILGYTHLLDWRESPEPVSRPQFRCWFQTGTLVVFSFLMAMSCTVRSADWAAAGTRKRTDPLM